MRLTITPIGRGNWRQVVLSIDSRHLQPLLVRPGQRFELGGVMWRIVTVKP